MRTVLLLIVLSVFASTHSSGQQKINRDTELTYDLLDATPVFPTDFSIKKNVRVRYRILNFNRNVYAITVNSETRSLFSEKPAQFNIITDIDLTKLTATPPANPNAIVGDPLGKLDNSSDAAEKFLIAKYLAKKNSVDSLITRLSNSNLKLKRLNSFYRSLASVLQDGTTPFATLHTNKLSLTYALLSADFNYTGGATDEAAMFNTLRAGADNLLIAMERDYSELLRRYSEMKQLLTAVEQLAASKVKTAGEGLKKANASQKKTIEQTMTGINNDVVREKAMAEGINEVIDDIKLVHAKVMELDQAGYGQTIANTYQKINGNNWEYISPSIKAQKDAVIIKMNIDPKEGTLFSPNYSQFNGEYTGSVYGFKINFSTGLFVIAGRKLFDQTYKVDTIPGDATNNVIVQNKNRQSVQPAVGALMHFYNKQPGFFSWGGAFGFSVSAQTKLNYHGGISFLFGEEQRVVLSGGAILSQVKELSNAYTVNQKIPKSAGLLSVPTDNFYRWGYFFSLTYNVAN